jgi:hypothetical protein
VERNRAGVAMTLARFCGGPRTVDGEGARRQL